MISKPMDLSEYWNQYAWPNAERLTKDAGILPSSVSPNTGMATLFPLLTTPSALQKVTETCAISDAPQLFIIEDLTGTGKTEAALTLAHRIMASGGADGLYVALPTMATANAMYGRVARAYRSLFEVDSNPSLVLAHGDNKLVKEFSDSILPVKEGVSREGYGKDEETAIGKCTQWLADNRKKSLLADVGIGTIDQALIAVLKSKYQSLRLFGLFGKVLIVDEVHACDSYMNEILKRLLEFHVRLGGSAILLSATLPTATKMEFAGVYSSSSDLVEEQSSKSPYPLVTHVTGSKQEEIEIPSASDVEKRVNVEFLHNESEVEKYLFESAREGLCACWIRNTVHDAIEAYEKLKEKSGDVENLLFHARFALGDRLDKERDIKSFFGKDGTHADRTGKILIATQVVEQSLDLDFDVMVSDLAPIDSLIQRAGRLRRHIRDSKGKTLTSINDLDERGEISLVVFGPQFVDKPSDEWYSRFFPKGSYVYPFHGELWLTAKLLIDKGGWSMPRDARNHIEKVFGSHPDIPPALKERDDLARGKDNAKSSYAHNSMLLFDDGYIKDALWDDDIDAVTRTGEISSTLYLARWNGKELWPWSDDDDHPWEYSRLSVRRSLIADKVGHTDQSLGKAVDEINDDLPSKGKYGILIPLEKGDDDLWHGAAVNEAENEVEIIYSKRFGLRVSGLAGV
jgi:CRISPR-associated endonuclease/helicase Cas3